MSHYHAVSGDHGCMPDHNSYCLTVTDAVDDLASLFNLGKRRRAELKRNWSLELNSHRDGAEYCEINECGEDCERDEFD
jgi:hypothetical protein